MRALVYGHYGAPDVVAPATVPDPRPGARDLVIEVHATTVNSGDARLRAADFPEGMGFLGRLAVGWSTPRQPVLGAELAGVVVEVGSKARGFAPGDRVVAMTGARMGAHAEQCLVRADRCVAVLPPTMSFDEATTLPFGGTTALTFLETKAALQPGERVLVIGASGAVGAACVQVARHFDAPVTGVCSAQNADLVRGLGAEAVIDYTTTDLNQVEDRWDVVIDTVGRAPVSELRRLATPRGRVGLVAGGIPHMLQAVWANVTGRQRILFGPADERADHLARLVRWLDEGTWQPVIDCRLPWDRAAEAHARVDSHRKRGSVVLTFRAAAEARDTA